MSVLFQDLRYALRMLVKNPGFTAVAILTLGLGIGANTAIFSVVNGVLFRPLPYPQPDRLMAVWMGEPQDKGFQSTFSDADFLDWQSHNQVFARVAAYTDTSFTLTGSGEPERLRGAAVTVDFFATLGIAPSLGRGFAAGEDAPESPRLVVLSHSLWRQRFGSDPGILGTTIRVNDVPRTVVGVMPPGFQFPPEQGGSPGPVEIWSLMTKTPPTRRGPYYLSGLGRLRDTASPQQAKAEVETIGWRIAKEHPLDNAGVTYLTAPLKEALVRNVRRPLLVLLGAVAFVLLIAAANVANLMLARTTAREREIAIRLAVGAGRGRIVRQWLTEGLLLALLGAGFGLLLAHWTTDTLLALSPANLPRLGEVGLDGRVLGFTLAVACLSGVFTALGSALHSTQGGIFGALSERAHGGENRSGRRTRNLLVIGETALSVMLLVGSALMITSFLRLQRVSPGFAPENILTLSVDLPSSRYEDAKVNPFYTQLLERVRALPGVEFAGIGNSLPPATLQITDNFSLEGRPAKPGMTAPLASVLFVSPDYFRALGVPILRGRNFTASDREGAPLVVMINETLARRYFPGQDPVGKRMKVGGPERPTAPWMEIVGVVGDVKFSGLQADPEPSYYEPYLQVPWSGTYLVVRSPSDPRRLARAVRQAVASLDPNLAVAEVHTMEDLMAASLATPRFLTILLTLFGSTAVLLAGVGLYGVVSYRVALRTNEIGIRMALGARPLDVVRMVISQGMALAAGGVLLGLGGAVILSRVLQGLLFGVTPNDPVTLVGSALLLVAVAGLACYLPARRASRVEPLVALRCE
ncbi:MAG: ABC transporter permease [Acidobacteria bacterium]|nr:ABC transporter permease [Acidobacteriota bacterium]